MPLEINGFIEYSTYQSILEREEESTWQAWMDISSIIDYVDEFTEYLFGYSKRVIKDNIQINALAKDRNIPKNPSDLVQRELNFIRESERVYGEETFGYTFAYYNEIMSKYNKEFDTKEWNNLFSLIDKFLIMKNINSDQVRFIVWFSW